MTTLINNLKQTRKEINALFLKELESLPMRANEINIAMEYTFISDGKALRPFLVLTIAKALNLDKESAYRIALALEMVHTYSLIHDDLPCMDNDTLRRGKPTCHIKFSESTAVLTGDALLTKAFEILANTHSLPTIIRCELISYLAKCAGPSGMIGGQVMDLSGEKVPLSLDEIYQMQLMKTGALLTFACTAPAKAAQTDTITLKALENYANAIGLLFQITDDLLDATGDEKTVGKTLQKDKKAKKSTFLSFNGLDYTKKLAQEIHSKAIKALDVPLLKKNVLLHELADFILTRKY